MCWGLTCTYITTTRMLIGELVFLFIKHMQTKWQGKAHEKTTWIQTLYKQHICA